MAARLAPANPHTISDAAALLRGSGLVAFPTETVYGLGADATDGKAVARIFAAKGRPAFNPLIVHVPGIEQAAQLAVAGAEARRLADAFWPGPLTLVLPRQANSRISELVSAGLPTLAIRAPDHPIAQAILRAADRPIAAPSANRSGHVSATRAEHVAADLGPFIDMIIDGGPTAHGIESTVLGFDGAEVVLLRPGAVSVDAIQSVIGKTLRRITETDVRPASPGRLESHYAPRARLRMNATSIESEEALLAFGPNGPASKIATINLSPSGDLIEAASNLFSSLRQLDESGATAIAVMPIPEVGLGEAINDRLRRAAAPRG